MSDASEKILAENVAANFAAMGYDVFLEPQRNMVPEFFGNYRPDIIALHKEKPNQVFEIRSRNRQYSVTLSKLRELFSGQSEWKFNVVWVEAVENPEINLVSVSDALDRYEEAVDLASERRYGAALVIGWSALEAIARLNFPEELSKPQLPRSVVQVLEAGGLISKDEASNLRRLIGARNEFVHGGNSSSVGKQECVEFFGATKHLFRDTGQSIAARKSVDLPRSDEGAP